MAPRAGYGLNCPTLPEAAIERIRRERRAPRPTQWDYLHLDGLQRTITKTFETLPITHGPVLDLYCGTQPYRELIPWQPVWGFDINPYFGRADVIGSLPLPFANAVFFLVFCTQALYLTDDPAMVVQEMNRVLAPGGYVVLTVPHIFRREIPNERKYSASDLRELFTGWEEIRVIGIDGLGAGLAYFPGSLAGAAAKRLSIVRLILPLLALLINGMGIALEMALRPFARRWPASFMLVARRPDS